jgi:branched-chain amino acid aminotransferase
MLLWRDGAVRETTVSAFDLADRGLLLADGVFDTLLVLNGQPFRAEAHRARLLGDAAALGFAIDPAAVEAAVGALAAAIGDGVVRVTATRGPGPRGLRPPAEPTPSLFATAAPLTPGLMFRPVRLAISPIRRNETSPTSRHKTLAYLDSVMAAEAAARAGFDDALMLNAAGRVACGTMANVFAVFGRRLVTPPVADGVLPGILRAEVVAAAAEAGLAAEERPLTPDELVRADGAFLTNSVRLVSPVTAVGTAAFAGAADAAIAAIAGVVRGRVAKACGAALPA